MFQKNIFPSESIEFTMEYHLWNHKVKSQVIYTIIVLSVITFLLLLPCIYVDITVQADGLIRPVSEKTEIRSIASGLVTQIFIKESQNITKGDTLLIFNRDNIESSIEFTKFQLSQTKDYINDLETLLDQNYNAPLKSATYRQISIEFEQKIIEIENRRNKAKKELERNTPLFKNGVIPEKEYDDLKYNHQLIVNELKTFKESMLSSWQADLMLKQKEKEQYLSQFSQYQYDKSKQIIIAPIEGTIEQFSGIYPGSNIQAGQTIAIISPASDVIAEVYASPKDIGFLSIGNKANIQVHAYNYNDWGMLQGKIIEISNDYILENNMQFFRVRCKLDKNYLQLKNGTTGNLKKGMTIRTRFIVNRRSLWQLLFDNLNDWMNPAQAGG